jgi:hypothetical protein
LIADSLLCVFQDFVPSCVVAAAGGLVSGYLAVCSLVLAFFAVLEKKIITKTAVKKNKQPAHTPGGPAG